MTGRAAAFFRVERGLSQRTALFAAAWLAANAQRIGERAIRLGASALALPAIVAGDGALALRIGFMGLRGTSEDRLAVLGEELFETWMRPTLHAGAVDLVRRAQREGRVVVLVSDNLDVVIGPLAAHLGADHAITNRMELRDGTATGRLEDPLIGAVPALREFAARNDLDLARSCGYGSLGDDATLLASVGLPCALNADRALRRLARALDWPSMEAT